MWLATIIRPLLRFIAPPPDGTAPPAPRPAASGRPLFDRLEEVLRLAGACPPGVRGDAIRRAACEMIEATTSQQRHQRRVQMLSAISRAEQHAHDAPVTSARGGSPVLGQLADALRDDFPDG